MFLPGCWVDVRRKIQKNAPHLSQFDVDASARRFTAASLNYKAHLFACFIIFFVRLGDSCRDKHAVELCDLVQGPVNDLGNAMCHFIFSFHFFTVCSSAAHAMISVCERMCGRMWTYPRIPSFPPPLLSYFPNDSTCLVKILSHGCSEHFKM